MDGFRDAFERVAKRLVEPPYSFPATGDRYMSLPFLRKHKYGQLPATFDELVEQNLDDDAIANFVNLLVAAELGGKPTKHVERGDCRLANKRGAPGFRYFDGDVVVRGNFAYEVAVLVRGDLTVDGLIEDAFEGSPLLVAGNVRARAMSLGSQTKIAGKAEATELIRLRFTRGGDTLWVAGGVKTSLYIWTEHDSKLTGKLTARYQVEAYPERDDLAKIRALLTPALAKQLDADEPDTMKIVDAARRGSIFR